MHFYSIILHILLSNSTIDRWDTGPKKDRNGPKKDRKKDESPVLTRVGTILLSIFTHNRQTKNANTKTTGKDT